MQTDVDGSDQGDAHFPQVDVFDSQPRPHRSGPRVRTPKTYSISRGSVGTSFDELLEASREPIDENGKILCEVYTASIIEPRSSSDVKCVLQRATAGPSGGASRLWHMLGFPSYNGRTHIDVRPLTYDIREKMPDGAWKTRYLQHELVHKRPAEETFTIRAWAWGIDAELELYGFSDPAGAHDCARTIAAVLHSAMSDDSSGLHKLGGGYNVGAFLWPEVKKMSEAYKSVPKTSTDMVWHNWNVEDAALATRVRQALVYCCRVAPEGDEAHFQSDARFLLHAPSVVPQCDARTSNHPSRPVYVGENRDTSRPHSRRNGPSVFLLPPRWLPSSVPATEGCVTPWTSERPSNIKCVVSYQNFR